MEKPTAVQNAVVLVNLGTPSEPTSKGVRIFLRRFLSDRRVVDLPRFLWLPILHCIILPLRSRKVARLYQGIWQEGGSPLLTLSQALTRKVAARLAGKYEVRLAMTYSQPELSNIVESLISHGCQRLILLPLYPQYSVSTTAPVFDAYCQAVAKLYRLPELRFISHYYNNPGYIQALIHSVREHWQCHGQNEVLVFSFHGIPERYARNGDPYPQQCLETAQKVASGLGLRESQWRISYQSRFGKEPWLTPYTDELLTDLAKEGVNSINVISPAFATDCLETLEEIQVELRECFIKAGGSDFSYIPALNDSDEHAKLLSEVILQHSQEW